MKRTKTHAGLTMRINENSCNGQEKNYAAWLRRKYPSLTVEVGSFASGLFDMDHNVVADHNDYWARYCNS